ncbi:hypothetical protein D3C78_1234080 [compost metagenome]
MAIEPARVWGLPSWRRRAACSTINRAACTWVAMSANFHWIAWNLAISLPNCWRSRANFLASSIAAVAMPTAWAAMPMRPESSAFMATVKPSPKPARRWESFTRTLVSTRSRVSLLRTPILWVMRPISRPGVPASTMKQLTPFGPGSSGLVRAKTRKKPA